MYEEMRKQVVKEALAGIKVAILARKYGVSPKSINTWVRAYRDQIGNEEIPDPDAHLKDMQRLHDIEEKYEKAIKVIGEKELEIEILRELVKKQNPAYPKNSR